MGVTILAEWIKVHPHSRVDILGDHVVLTFGPKSPDLLFPAWMWLIPWFWPFLALLSTVD